MHHMLAHLEVVHGVHPTRNSTLRSNRMNTCYCGLMIPDASECQTCGSENLVHSRASELESVIVKIKFSLSMIESFCGCRRFNSRPTVCFGAGVF